MDRKSLTFTVALVVNITLSLIPITAQNNDVPQPTSKASYSSQWPAPTPAKPGSDPQRASTEKEQAAKSEPRITNGATTPNQLITAQPDFAIQQTNGQKDGEWSKDWGMLVFTGMLVAVGMWQGFTFWRQTTILERQLKATESAAKASESAANTARDALHLSEAADVLFVTHKAFETSSQTWTDVISPTTEIVIVHRNFGRTRAKDVRVRWRLYLEGTAPPDTLFLPPVVVGAGAELETRIQPTIGQIAGSPERFLAIKDGCAILKAIGEVSFLDVFGKSHSAKFLGTFRPLDAAFAVDTEITEDEHSQQGQPKNRPH